MSEELRLLGVGEVARVWAVVGRWLSDLPSNPDPLGGPLLPLRVAVAGVDVGRREQPVPGLVAGAADRARAGRRVRDTGSRAHGGS